MNHDTCLFSVSYAGFWGQHTLSLEAFIAKAGALGFDAVMLMGKRPHLSPLDAGPERLAVLRAALATAGVRCRAIGAYTDFANSGAVEVPAIEQQILYVGEMARLAAALGAGGERPIVRVFTAYDRGGLGLAWDRVAQAVRECCDRAAPLGVTIAVQNHHDLAVHTDALLEFLHTVGRDNCRLGFDAWSPALRGEDLYQAARKAAPYTVLTTNADYVRLPAFTYDPARVSYAAAASDLLRAVPFGEGFIDYPAYWRGLADGGFDGVRAYEMCSPLRGGGGEANLDHCARSFLSCLRNPTLAKGSRS